MKIKNKYPVLDLLQRRVFTSIHSADGLLDKFGKDGCSELLIRAAGALKEVKGYYYITDTFYDAHTNAASKIESVEFELAKMKFESRVVMYLKGFSIIRNVIYDGLEFSELFIFDEYGLFGYGLLNLSVDANNQIRCKCDGHLYDVGNELSPKELFIAFWKDLHTLLYFIEVCEIETKIIPAKSKHRNRFGNNICNDTKNEILVLDCRWFTELVRNTPFTVTGHFRWQPCGENRTKRKLIWIEPFEKQGYHRKATKELQTP